MLFFVGLLGSPTYKACWRGQGHLSRQPPPRARHLTRELAAGGRHALHLVVAQQVPPASSSPTAAASSTSSPSRSTTHVERHFETFRWRCAANGETYRINYRVTESDAVQRPVFHMLLVHGFGANLLHFRKNVDALAAAGARVFSIDLLGFGASDKPVFPLRRTPENGQRAVAYSLELWRDLCVDFVNEMERRYARDAPFHWVLCGNSIGSLVALMTGLALDAGAAATAATPPRLRGLVLLNCAGGLTGFRYSELSPLGSVVWWLFRNIAFRPPVVHWLFERARRPENLLSTLRMVYRDHTHVTAELVEILRAPASEEGARHVFEAVLRGEPGPTPRELLQQLRPETHLLLLWGREDPWTPYEKGLYPATRFSQWTSRPEQVELVCLDHCGHCPHDEAPERVNREVGRFLSALQQSMVAAAVASGE
ncbi:hypothetical protein CDCA_CDCA05G1692 [Cyanidium caldarium]|uniref:AB hydrolase-1 domain-containing protein n=1 Tax=Cyanidium caldarium TaxID=2771 RepID=A0AAV9ITL0_CYACA|nr:hypothetical protein CDCA_CDCA05G1692 [Cyanidium caldarium]